MTVEELLDQFDDLIEDAFTLPFSSKKVVDASKARDITVSYTHLDVYKRQNLWRVPF